MTPEAQKRRAAEIEHRRAHAFEDPEVFPLGERCVNFGIPRLQAGYNSYLQIVQAPGYVTIMNEMAHDARIIPLDGRPHLDRSHPRLERRFARALGRRHAGHRHHQLLAEERVHGRAREPAPHRTLHPRRSPTFSTTSSPSTIRRRGRRRGRAMIPLKLKDERIYEYACHEGNEAIPDMLRGHRFEEREAARSGRK